MRKASTIPFMAILVAAAVSGDASAAPSATAISIAATGEGNWYVRCELEGAASDATLVELSTSRHVWGETRLQRATCRYQASRTPLTLTVTGTGWTCPAPAGSDGTCQLVIPPARAGEFRLVRAGGGAS